MFKQIGFAYRFTELQTVKWKATLDLTAFLDCVWFNVHIRSSTSRFNAMRKIPPQIATT